MRRFRYCGDPLFLLACVLYAANRWWWKRQFQVGFLNDYFNDLLLIPCALPPVLWLQRRLGLRGHDAPPDAREILLHLAVWSVLFEIAGPHLMQVVGDMRDIAAYAVGALVAGWFWSRKTGNQETAGLRH